MNNDIQGIPAEGMILVCKDAGWTSFDVTAKLRGLLHTRKVGHTGTLDPDATGVLPVLYGKATRLAELWADHDKAYEAVLQLGIETDTQDLSGRVLASCPNLWEYQDMDRIREVISGFQGDQLQIPPMYSALKVQGKKLCDLARDGIVVERQPRQVRFEKISIKKIAFPLVTLEISCSKGTYIRTLCHDIGQRLGCGGAMKSLIRTRVGDFSLSQCATVGELQAAAEQNRLSERILTLEQILSSFPCLTVPPQAERLLLNGNPLPTGLLVNPSEDEGLSDQKIRMYTPQGQLVGLYVLQPERNRYVPCKML